MERLIDPVLTDVQIEYRDAIAQGRVWRSRWIRLAGYVALLKVIALYGYERAMRDWSRDDGRAFARTVGVSAAAIVVATAVLLVSPAVREPRTDLLVYLIPQALPLAIPVGLTVGMFCGLAGRVASFPLKGAILAVALTCSAGSLMTMAWMVPAAGQAYRVSVAEHVRQTKGKEATLPVGASEMTTAELRRTIDSLTKSGRARDARTAAFVYHVRRALPWAPFVLALFALAVMPRLPVRHWIPAAAACGTCLSYYLFLLTADMAVRQGMPGIAAAVWLPNLLFAAVSTALPMRGANRRASAQA
jgi:hypothetical protein